MANPLDLLCVCVPDFHTGFLSFGQPVEPTLLSTPERLQAVIPEERGSQLHGNMICKCLGHLYIEKAERGSNPTKHGEFANVIKATDATQASSIRCPYISNQNLCSFVEMNLLSFIHTMITKAFWNS